MEFFIIKDKKQRGPYTLEQLAEMGITSDTPVWHEGLGPWKPAWQVEELKDLLAGKTAQQPTPPPVPPQLRSDDRVTPVFVTDLARFFVSQHGAKGGDGPLPLSVQQLNQHYGSRLTGLAAGGAAPYNQKKEACYDDHSFPAFQRKSPGAFRGAPRI